MRNHTANQLKFRGNILAPDGVTVLTSAVPCGLEDLSGRRLEQAQLIAAETSHMILMRTGDASTLTDAGYISVEGTLYIVDYRQDPREPRPKMWLEVYCHVERSGN